MTHSILITGASGYLGGTLLARWKEANLTGYDKLFALVRKPGQAQAVKQYGAEPLEFDIEDNDVVKKVILQHQITIVYFLIDAFNSKKQRTFIEALAEVKAKTGQDVHFLHVGIESRYGAFLMPADYWRKDVLKSDRGSH